MSTKVQEMDTAFKIFLALLLMMVREEVCQDLENIVMEMNERFALAEEKILKNYEETMNELNKTQNELKNTQIELQNNHFELKKAQDELHAKDILLENRMKISEEDLIATKDEFIAKNLDQEREILIPPLLLHQH